jgi:hypothetical protein
MRLWVLAAVLLAVAMPAGAQDCGRTGCPPNYAQLYCYHAGEHRNDAVRYTAKICITEGANNTLVRGDVVATIERAAPFYHSNPMSLDGTLWGERVYVKDCYITYISGAGGGNPYRRYETKGFAVEVHSAKEADHFIIEPQLSATLMQGFRSAQNVVAQCTFDKVEPYARGRIDMPPLRGFN